MAPGCSSLLSPTLNKDPLFNGPVLKSCYKISEFRVCKILKPVKSFQICSYYFLLQYLLLPDGFGFFVYVLKSKRSAQPETFVVRSLS